MECREVRRLADAFVSAELPAETMEAVALHLQGCDACRAEVEGLRRLRLATRAAFSASPGLAARPEFLTAMTARLQAESRQPLPARFALPAWLAVAASLLVVAGLGLGVWGWSASSLSALLRAAVGDHQFCALTFKLAEPPITLDEADRRYHGFYKQLEAVEPTTAALSGGPLQILDRHSCVFGGRRFAHIVMRYKDQTVSLLVADDDRPGRALWNTFSGDAGTLSALPPTDGFQVASFRGPGQMVFVVSSLNDNDLREVAQAMAEPVSRALGGV